MLDLETLMIKHPSPVANPANQCLAPGVLLSNLVLGTSGLGTGITWVKASLNISDKPLLRVALMLISSINPASVKCFLLLIKSKACLNNIKSRILKI